MNASVNWTPFSYKPPHKSRTNRQRRLRHAFLLPKPANGAASGHALPFMRWLVELHGTATRKKLLLLVNGREKTWNRFATMDVVRIGVQIIGSRLAVVSTV